MTTARAASVTPRARVVYAAVAAAIIVATIAHAAPSSSLDATPWERHVTVRELLWAVLVLSAVIVMLVTRSVVFGRRVTRELQEHEARAKQERERADLLFRSTRAGLLDWDAITGAVVYSDRFKEMLGYAADTDLASRPLLEFVHPEDREHVRVQFKTDLRDRSTTNAVKQHRPLEYRLLRRDGESVWVHTESIALRGPDGRTLRFIGSFIDITDRQREQLELSNRVKFTNDLFDSIPLTLALRDPDGRYMFVNRTWERSMGAPRELIVGRTMRELVAPDEAETVLALDRAAFTLSPGGPLEPHDFAYRGRRYLQTRNVLADAAGRVIGVLIAGLDITEKYATEQAFALERDRLRLLVRASRAGFTEWDAETDVWTYSGRFKEMLGYEPETDTSAWRTLLDVMHPDDCDHAREDFRAMLRRSATTREREHGPNEYRLRRTDGTYIWVRAEGVAQIDEHGRTQRFITSFIDITRLHEQEEALRASRDDLAVQAERMAEGMKFINDLIDSVPMAISVRDLEGRYVLVNRTWERYYEVPRERAVGGIVREVLGLTPEQAAPRDDLDRATLEAGPENASETPDFKRRGRIYSSRRTGMRDAQGNPLGIILATLDVTERRAMEETLATEQRRLALVVRASKAGIIDWDGLTRTGYYSPPLREMLGYAPDADTSTWPDYFGMVHPDDRAHVHAAFREHITGTGPEGAAEFHEAIEYRLRRADGSHVWVQGIGVSVRDATGYATRFIASITDITERRAHEQALRENIRLREEVERISRHDIKTPLNSVIAVPRLLREERRLRPEDDELLSIVERAGYRILNMVNLSLDLFKMEQGTYRLRAQAVDLVQLLDTVLADVRSHAASKNVGLRIARAGEAAGNDAPVLGLAEELLTYSILANLMKNAVEASPDGGTVTITLDSGPQTIVRIHNTGVVPVEVRERFFEKYATARKSDGLGLGTYSARLMARVQEGDLTMDTSDAAGTTLTLSLQPVPASLALPASEPAEVTGVEPTATDELPPLRVLVVDDDEYNRLVVRRYLPSPPLEVDAAVNGRAALEIAIAKSPHVILMDLDMPVMSGFEATRRVREHERGTGRAASTIIALSSHDDDDTRRRSHAAGCDAYLTKPVTRATLLKTMRELTRSGTASSVAAAETRPQPFGIASDDVVDVDPDLKDSVPAFIESRGPAVDEMMRALGGATDVPLRRLAHRAAGSFGLYGFRWAANQCRRIEHEAEHGDQQQLEALLSALKRHVETVEIRCDGSPIR